MEGVEVTTADVGDCAGEALSKFDACSPFDCRGVDGGSAASVRVLGVRGEGNARGSLGLEGRDRVSAGPVSAVRNAAGLASSWVTDDNVIPHLRLGLVGDPILRFFVGVSGTSACSSGSSKDWENATVRFCDVALDIINSRSRSLPFIADLMGDLNFCGEKPGNLNGAVEGNLEEEAVAGTVD